MTRESNDMLAKIIASDPALTSLWADFQRGQHERAVAAAKADPVAHKLTRVFDGPMRWQFWQTRNRRGQIVRFAYTTTRNAAGYFLGWREVITKAGDGKRDMWTASRTRGVVRARAAQRVTAARAALEKAEG